MTGWKQFIGIIGLLLSFPRSLMAQPATPASAPGTPARFVDVGGYKLRMQVAGSGTPTVVFEAGAGDTLDAWSDVFPQVARFTRVVAYNRAGLGKSEPGPAPRTFTRYATELHTMLRRAGIPPPYVLVGHSLGAADVRAFARLFQDEVAGLVFVDPFNEQIFRSVSAKENEEEIARNDAASAKDSAGQKAEWAVSRGETLNDFPELGSFGRPPDVPMMLIVAGRERGPAGLWVKAVLAKYGSWIAEASEGGLVVDPESRHYIQRDNPALVISAIRRVVFPSVQNVLVRTIKEKGIDTAIPVYRQMRQRYPAEFFRESTLNTLGYQQLRSKHVPEAIALFTLNVEMYPGGFNAADSLAEAYLEQGDREAAIRNYRKSLALNPNNTNAINALKSLGAEPAASQVSSNQTTKLEVRLAEKEPGTGLVEATVSGSDQKIYLNRDAIVTNGDVVQARVVPGNGGATFNVAVVFSPDGSQKMSQATAAHMGRPLAILVNGRVIAALTLRAQISNEALITGTFTQSEAEAIASGLNSR